MKEIIELVVSERNHIKIDAYGDVIYNHSFSKSHHFIEIKKILDGEKNEKDRYNFGYIKFSDLVSKALNMEGFSSQLNSSKYSEMGKNFVRKG